MFPIFSIYDKKLAEFTKPFVSQNAIQAAREFQEAINNKNIPLLNKYPEDYDLYKINEIDPKTGKTLDDIKPVYLCSGIEMVRKGEKNNEN